MAASDTSGETGGSGTGPSDTVGTTGADGSSAGNSSAATGWSASRTRDHLANERTYLAWLRTAANVMVLGLAIARLIGDGGTRSLAAGAVLVTVGAAGLVYGAIRYRRVNVEIEQGTRVTEVGVGGPMIAAVVLIAAIAATLALLTVP
ncbi:MAG TPA: DUF202 domain-containing protein [Streptosporangiaceae bacterium]